MLNNRVPPNSIEAEQSLLGAAMVDKIAVIEIVQQLEINDFYSPENQAIFDAIYELNNSNKPIDIITVSEKLKYMGKLELIGGIEHLSILATEVITTANIKAYIQIVKGKSIRRKYITAAMSVIESAYDGEYETINDFKSDALKHMDIPIKEKSITTIQDITNSVLMNIQERFNNKSTKLPYGIQWLDRNTGGAHDTDLTILAARPSVGKTSLAMQFGLNFASRKKNVAIFSLEMSKEQLVERLMANVSKVQFERLRYPANLENQDHVKLAIAIETINNLNLHIFDDIFKIESIRAKCMELKAKNSLDAVIIDYLQLCETNLKKSSENERVGYVSRESKKLAKVMRVPVILLSQLTRDNERDNRRPKLTDLRSSGAIEQDADNVFFLHDAEYGNYTTDNSSTSEIELIIAKQRNGLRDIYTNVKFYKNTQMWGN